MRIEPPPSVPMASGPSPAATAALAPPLEPPGVRSRFHGLRVTPKSRLWVAPIQPIIGVFVLPSWMPPAARMRSTIGASSVGTLSAKSHIAAASAGPATSSIAARQLVSGSYDSGSHRYSATVASAILLASGRSIGLAMTPRANRCRCGSRPR